MIYGGGMNLISFAMSSIVLLASGFAMVVFMGLWTFADAKVRSDEPILWTLIAVFGNPIGIILYLTIGRKNDEESPGTYKVSLIISCICFLVSMVVFLFTAYAFILSVA